MNYSFLCHPDHPALAVDGIGVQVDQVSDGNLRLKYVVSGTSALVLPRRCDPGRADDLWKTTCFELFLRFDDDERYVEFNFAPSTRWAAYAFEGYREGMTDLDIAPPRIERSPDGVTATIDLGGLPRGEHRMALTAVIEEEGGTKSYWSLAHPPGAPDFHHPACFVARLPAPERP